MNVETTSPTPPPDAFRFGRNWQRYVEKHLNPERQRFATESLIDLVGDVRDKRFLDIGAGSGLFSLCAHKLGAGPVVSVDVDADSVESCKTLRETAGAPDDWDVVHGSILDSELVNKLGQAAIVYSWGVLHHTGDMYKAIDHAASLVAPGGILCIAIYNRVEGGKWDSTRWWKIKRFYSRAKRPVQVTMELGFRAAYYASQVVKGRNPRSVARDHLARGMALKTDLTDWLGGFPFEYATAEEITTFCESRTGLKLKRLVPVGEKDIGNHQFVFERPDSG